MLDGTPVAGLPVRVIGLQGEARVDDEVEKCFVLKQDIDAVVIAAGKELNALQRLALGLFKEVESASGIAADGGLTPLRFFVSQQRRDSFLSEFGLEFRGIAAFGRRFGPSVSRDRSTACRDRSFPCFGGDAAPG